MAPKCKASRKGSRISQKALDTLKKLLRFKKKTMADRKIFEHFGGKRN